MQIVPKGKALAPGMLKAIQHGLKPISTIGGSNRM